MPLCIQVFYSYTGSIPTHLRESQSSFVFGGLGAVIVLFVFVEIFERKIYAFSRYSGVLVSQQLSEKFTYTLDHVVVVS